MKNIHTQNHKKKHTKHGKLTLHTPNGKNPYPKQIKTYPTWKTENYIPKTQKTYPKRKTFHTPNKKKWKFHTPNKKIHAQTGKITYSKQDPYLKWEIENSIPKTTIDSKTKKTYPKWKSEIPCPKQKIHTQNKKNIPKIKNTRFHTQNGKTIPKTLKKNTNPKWNIRKAYPNGKNTHTHKTNKIHTPN